MPAEAERDTDVRHDAAALHVEAMRVVERITGRVPSRDRFQEAYHHFLSGFDAGVEAAGKGELLTEAITLQNKAFDVRLKAIDRFIARVRKSLPDEALANFRPMEERSLRLAMLRCGLKRYPDRSGPWEGFRASGQMVCEKCDCDYYSHPMDWRIIGHGNVPYLHVLCDGRRVKLSNHP
jgi:hypothetical protein